MEANILDKSGKKASTMEVPEVFNEPFRPDVIKKAVLAAQANRLQPYGPDRTAGTLTSAHSWGSGRGAAHVPRLTNGSRAARVTQAKGGRSAHAPNPNKDYSEKINDKERILAIRSAAAATMNKELVKARGYKFEGELPLIVSDDIESFTKTKEVVELLTAIGLEADLERAKIKQVRGGRGKMRGRQYKKKVGVLIVVGEDKGIVMAARNIPGCDVVTLDEVNTELLAPGTQAGRLTVWSESALKMMEGEQ
ncbi:50S ribosomal protein L4P [Methanocella paludicola SANAE]|uniref:Large ribosomal subunit protein uL4 n=1 Tax=Methanocella paludicola (strain DSM 17711 / JCM 13418 / NBRC 101707 / SANAE) TaxID=304371 RepID=D1Z0S1_METPS|nr:50S ribosomal protein L4 [Methanocella paludicola]BAI62293.1 50S ribosomal protein L4P [Methanocella paludicola SANAE]